MDWPDIQNGVKILYNVSSCIVNNGFASKFSPLERGVRQGLRCPLFGLLFIIGIELLVRAIKNDDSLYADGTIVFLRDLDSVAH